MLGFLLLGAARIKNELIFTNRKDFDFSWGKSIQNSLLLAYKENPECGILLLHQQTLYRVEQVEILPMTESLLTCK